PLAVVQAPLATETLVPVATITPSATATIAPTITPSPLPSPTPTPTQQPTETAVVARVAGISAETHLDPNTIVEDSTLLTPQPTPTLPLPTPYPSGDYTERVAILMYHYLEVPPSNADKYRLDLSVEPDEFRKQLTYLRDNGYTTISLYDLARAMANQQELPPKPIILTFDDGYLNNYTNAFPLLKEFGMTATFFIITDLPDIQHPEYASWSMLEEMAAAGMSIEIHTKSHRSLADREFDYLKEEIAGAQEIIAFHTGKLPRFLSYPGGTYDDATIEAVREFDLWGALTTKYGYTHDYWDRYEMTRVRIRHSTTIDFFGEWIEGER
ncbi:MAG TPA: polysaccharide deacetylase family protein, partial [Anaerolineae bacterium]|nr:polysaccharide deacetylase family protein [Anaerolineae bacterium]